MTLIVIDGLDGSGKSTQANCLAAYLKSQNKSYLLRIHPEKDNYFGVKASQFLCSRGKNAHFASALFYMLDVINSIIRYSWRREDFIIFVRYLMGTAYLPAPLHLISYCFFALIVPKAETMFFLDVMPERAHYRIRVRDKQEMFEDKNKLAEVRLKALSLVKMGKWVIVDSNKSAKEVTCFIEKEIKQELSGK
ncbi:MAG: thymidylate kinase [Candidatus Bathyarchaeota archaeon]|nr:thymidylate kinase [Candidatus Bathyarchaeota archaeon]